MGMGCLHGGRYHLESYHLESLSDDDRRATADDGEDGEDYRQDRCVCVTPVEAYALYVRQSPVVRDDRLYTNVAITPPPVDIKER